MPVREVVIARFSALGDVAMTIPVVYAACRANPDVRFTLLTRKPFNKIFVDPPANLDVRAVDLRGQYKGVRGMWRLSRELHADVFVDLHSVLRTWMLGAFMRLRGVPTVRFDKARKAKRRAVSQHSGIVSPTLDRYVDALSRAGLNSGQPRALFNSTRPTKPVVGIAPFAAHAGKIYPLERMRRVVELLSAKGYDTVLFGGGQAEKEILDGWAAEIRGTRSAVGLDGGFPAEMQLMSTLSCMVAMDSGNMHLAAVSGVPVVSIWGATRPVCGFTPFSAAGVQNIALQAEADCAPCSVFGNRPCRTGDFRCMNLSPETVVEAVESIINTSNDR